jgi:hypothetical protein
MATRRELKAAIRERYQAATRRGERREILSELVRVTGYHRKHALRVLNQAPPPQSPRPRGRLYDEAVRQAGTVLWEAGDRICGKRLKALIPVLIDAMERHGHLELDTVVRTRLLGVSAATIDRLLGPQREAAGRARRRRWGAGSAIRQSVPIRTFADWGDPPPGYCECDMVEHCGGVKEGGNFVHTLTLTDIHSGWTECAALVVREQCLVVEGIDASSMVAALIRRRRGRPPRWSITASIPCRSTTRRMRRMWRGVIARISAACTQLNCLAIALVITSRRVIERASRRIRRSIFSIARLYPTPRTSLNVYAPDISNVYDIASYGFCRVIIVLL